jgi:hypothetical protein
MSGATCSLLAKLRQPETLTRAAAAEQASRAFDEYVKLTSAGKLAEAGEKLEEIRAALETLREAEGATPPR